MILRRYGTSYHSVDIDFDAKALSEFGFRRNREHSVPVDELDGYEVVSEHEFNEEAEGPVQHEAMQEMLDKVQAQVEGVYAGLTEGQVLVVDNDQGHDYPKPRQDMKNVIVEGENRLYFGYTMSPSLRVSVRQPTG